MPTDGWMTFSVPEIDTGEDDWVQATILEAIA